MPDFLLELFSEEIPARMQGQAAKDLERLVVGALTDRGLLFEGVKSFAGPRRLTLAISGLPPKQPDVKEEKKGPRVNAPEKAILGFLKSAGVTIEQCQRQDDGKGEFYIAVIDRKGRDTADVLAEIVPEACAKLPWPKSMRFPGSAIRWVRPLHGIIATFDGEVVPFEFAGVKSGNTTFGHRFLSSGPIEVRRFDDYVKKLRDAFVIVDADERKEIIQQEAKTKAFALGLELIDDEGLLSEVAGLAEWPVVLIGNIESEFMDLPPEILQTSMRTHQKYFALRFPPPQSGGGGSPRSGETEGARLAPKFVLVANMVAKDGGKEIVAGNERVLRARLSDAKFFWDQDRKIKLTDRVDALKTIRFYKQFFLDRKIDGIRTKAVDIAEELGVKDIETVSAIRQAADLCKADLVTGLVGEFPELQGVMGYYYALNENLDRRVADAIRDHYKPLGPSDAVSKSLVTNTVALGDKLTSLYWLFLEGERPTGSKDPYGLRRAALGIVRIILENEYHLGLSYLLGLGKLGSLIGWTESRLDETNQALLEFIIDRLKVALREKGTRHDLIDAVFSLGNEDDLVRLVARVEALQSFLKTDDGANLLAGYKRAANILRIEEKKDGKTFGTLPDVLPSAPTEERDLAHRLEVSEREIAGLVMAEKFVQAMSLMASLRAPVDAFFDKVKVNDDDGNVRENRLKLLSRLRATLHLVADFSKIEG
ncbi:MAG TPA: glycine--tRNA ligase subunit beta [Rhizomicrobium sp.]|jgi:glycyl-tRNA synthetase beta chain|nr:glycine--tRNA ligase subunit beta [Rhizomicrobium sp.]